MDINLFNNLRLEYSVGANVIILSLIDTSEDKSVLVSDNVSKILVKYSYNNQEFEITKDIEFHVNSILIFIDNIPERSHILFTPYLVLKETGETIQITDTIDETTLNYGNINYEIITSDDIRNDSVIRDKFSIVIDYINKMGSYVDSEYDQYAIYARTIPVKYDANTQTASAYYYKSFAENYYGLVQTSGGVYADNSTFFHELRHRYGITSPYLSNLTRDHEEGRTDIYSYIEDKYKILHDALRFETGREDAKVWVFDAHSNILEGNYTNEGVMNYLAANYLKALIWYTCHTTLEQDTSKIRIIVPINIIYNENPDNPEEPENPEEESDGINRCFLSTLIKPYIIDKDIKVFLTSNLYSNGYINKSLNLTLYPYDNIASNIYVNNELNPTTTFINDDIDFRLQSKLGFDNNIISILNTFEFPGKIKKENNYYNVDIHGDYTELDYQDKYTTQISKFYNSFFINENIQNELDQEDFRDELDIENIRTTGFVIQIATDLKFEDIVFESIINTDNQDNNFIYDFSFSLDNIVNDWKQLNDILVIRSKFIDKRLNICIVGNNVVLTKEWFKYLINDTNIGHVIFDKQNNLINKKFMDINQGFNFIDSLNCVIVDNKESNNVESSISNTSTQIIYKPVFYRVQDLQNLRIRQGVTQNIGINLGEFMTKIDLFILNIDGNNIKESSRNDVNVIFNINANIIENNNGIYNILDQNFDYVSSGNYMLY